MNTLIFTFIAGSLLALSAQALPCEVKSANLPNYNDVVNVNSICQNVEHQLKTQVLFYPFARKLEILESSFSMYRVNLKVTVELVDGSTLSKFAILQWFPGGNILVNFVEQEMEDSDLQELWDVKSDTEDLLRP